MRLLLAAIVALAVARDTAAQIPELAVEASAATNYRPVVHIGPVLAQGELAEAAASGLPIRMRVRVELWRDGWIDDLVASESWSAVVAYDPLSETYFVRGRSTTTSTYRFPSYATARGALEGAYPLQIRPSRAGRYYYLATLQVETLSLSDLEELERWLQGELQPAVRGDRSVGGAIGQGMKRLGIRLLNLPARHLEARTGRFRVN